MKEPEPSHSHPHEQISYVADGEIIFFRGSEQLHLFKGDIITIPPGVPHGDKILSKQATIVDCFYPLRKEFLTTK